MSQIVDCFQEFRKLAFQNIYEIIEKSNCSKFEIIGYKWLDIKLLLIFDDCVQVFIYEYDEDQKCVNVQKYFTKDFSHEENLVLIKEFGDRFKLEKFQPENVEEIEKYNL
jgi:hypothetical protein